MGNVGEHLPEYIKGQGHMQRTLDPRERRGEQRQLGCMTWTHYERGLHIVILVRGGRTCVLAGRVPAHTIVGLAVPPVREYC
jgi:hypothetical protein